MFGCKQRGTGHGLSAHMPRESLISCTQKKAKTVEKLSLGLVKFENVPSHTNTLNALGYFKVTNDSNFPFVS